MNRILTASLAMAAFAFPLLAAHAAGPFDGTWQVGSGGLGTPTAQAMEGTDCTPEVLKFEVRDNQVEGGLASVPSDPNRVENSQGPRSAPSHGNRPGGRYAERPVGKLHDYRQTHRRPGRAALEGPLWTARGDGLSHRSQCGRGIDNFAQRPERQIHAREAGEERVLPRARCAGRTGKPEVDDKAWRVAGGQSARDLRNREAGQKGAMALNSTLAVAGRKWRSVRGRLGRSEARYDADKQMTYPVCPSLRRH